MKIENIIKKMKQFGNDTEAISPIIATIMVLVVAVAAGAGLYFWFDNFQEDVQVQVGESATGNMRSMVIGSANVVLRPLSETYSFDDIDASSDTATDNSGGDGSIYYATDEAAYYGGNPNGKNGEGWKDERFIVEIPITISSNADLTGAVLMAERPEATMGTLRSNMWLHLDRENEYQLLKTDDTQFKGFIDNSTNEVFENETDGYTYYFGGETHLGLDMVNGIMDPKTGTLADDPDYHPPNPHIPNAYLPDVDESNLYPPSISRTSGSLMVMKLYAFGGESYNAFAKNGSDELGWVTCNHSKSAGADPAKEYFNGDKLQSLFGSDVSTYKVTEDNKLTANEPVTVYTYFMIDVLSVDEDDGYAELVIPYRVITDEGVIGTNTVTLTVKD